MTKMKLDKIFKEKLEKAEVQPSNQALEKFQEQLNGNNRSKVWYYLAASIAMLIGLTWFIQYSLETSEPEKVIASQDPALPENNTVEVEQPAIPIEQISPVATIEVKDEAIRESAPITQDPDITSSEPMDQIEKIVEASTIAMIEESAHDQPENPDTLLIEESTLPIEMEELVASIEEEPEVLEAPEKPLPVVTITYISGRKKRATLAQAEMPQDTATIKNGTINTILNSARSIADGSLIAGLRDAKESFFNKNDD